MRHRGKRDSRQEAGGTALVLALAIAGGLTVLGFAQLWWMSAAGRGVAPWPLAAHMRIEEPITNLSSAIVDAGLVDSRKGSGVRLGTLTPGFKLTLGGRQRDAIIAPPPARITYATRPPEHAVLRFGIAVAGDGKRDPTASAVRFAVRIGGREIFAREINPAASRGDRRWFDEGIPLDQYLPADGPVELEFVTAATNDDAPLSGTPGWSHLRLVREVIQERQLATAAAPNVLLLLVDTLRADRLGVYGARPSPSPTLDAIAADGMVFEQVIAQAPWTLPSVASIFTGLHPRSHGLAGRSAQPGPEDETARHPAADPHYLSDRLDTIASAAQRAGITTVGVSANPLVSRGTNLARGFETFVEFGAGDGGVWTRAEDVNRAFLDWLQHNGHYRFFGYLHYMDTHGPYVPPAAYRPVPPAHVRRRVARGDVHKLPGVLPTQGEGALSPLELSYLQALYDGEIRYWDAELATLLDDIRAAGLPGPTVLIVTSDHGEEFMEHGGLNHGRHLYDEVIRVPLVIGGADIPGRRVVGQVEGLDLHPTVLTLLDIDTPSWLPGRSVLTPAPHRDVLSETRRRDKRGGTTDIVALRTPAWKLIYSSATQHFELYDLRRDPAEQHDRFTTAPEGDRLVRALRAWMANVPAPPEATGYDPGFQDKLRALGYLHEEEGTDGDVATQAP